MFQYANNATATLAASISAAATTINLASGQGALFPTPVGSSFFHATLVDALDNREIVKVTTRAADTLTVSRAQEGTTARAYNTGDRLELWLTAAALENMVQKDAANVTFAGALAADSFSGSGTGLTGTATGLVAGKALTANDAAAGDSSEAVANTKFVMENSVLVGAGSLWFLPTAPDGYYLLQGQAVSRTANPRLFARFRTTFGAGDGSTTFGLPDMRDRFPLGAGTIGALNATGGSKDAVVVSHSHTAASTVNDPGHSHSITTSLQGSSGGGVAGDMSFNNQTQTTAGASTGISVSTTVNANGVSGANANLPPYVGVNFIVRAG